MALAPKITIASPLNRVSETPVFQLSVLLEDTYGIPAVTVTQDDETIPQNRIQAGLGPGSKRGEWQLMLPIEIAPGLTKTFLRVRATNPARRARSSRSAAPSTTCGAAS